MERITVKLPGKGDFFTQEAFKVLRTNLQFCGDNVHIVALTSCNENEGKTTVTLGLGKSLAELGRKVLIIDADMRKSVMAGRNTNVKNAFGLSELLTGQCSLADCIYATQYESMHIIFAGKYPPNPVELLNGENFSALLTELKNYYDYILIDTPPLGRVIDAATIAPNCDGTILVIDGENIRRTQAQEVVEQLNKVGGKLLGAVWNNTQKRKFAYYSKSGHYGKYGEYGQR